MNWTRTQTATRIPGFTLLECLVAVVVLAIGVMGVIMCLSASSVMNWRAQRLAIAFGEDMRVMEDIREYNGPASYINWMNTTVVPNTTNGKIYDNRTNVVVTVNGSTTTITSKLSNTLLNNNTQTITVTTFSDANNPKMTSYLNNVSVTTTWLADTGTTRSNTLAATFITRQY
jgi:prepilin-type N-terminal cleavage/methylation domain-containing protein